eukprot:SAG22_NODE_7199_length_763_cov_1.091867_1_plen_85_part_01
MVFPAGIPGYTPPTYSQDPSASFAAGALSPGRITGNVLAMPPWPVTAAHAARAEEIGSSAGVWLELGTSGPAVVGLVLLVFAVRY